MFMLSREKGGENATFHARSTVVSHGFVPDFTQNATDSRRTLHHCPPIPGPGAEPVFLSICIVYETDALSIREGGYANTGALTSRRSLKENAPSFSRRRNWPSEANRASRRRTGLPLITSTGNQIRTAKHGGVGLPSATRHSALATLQKHLNAPPPPRIDFPLDGWFRHRIPSPIIL